MKLDTKNWKKVRFDDVVTYKKSTIDAESSGLEKYIAGEHMASEDLHLRKWGIIGDGYLGPAFHSKFERGDILYGSRRTYLKKVALADFDGITSNTTFVLKENTELVVPGFIPFLMLSDSFTKHSVKNSKGSVNPYINFKDIGKYEFLLPPRDHQIKLAELLWAAENTIEKFVFLAQNIRVTKSCLNEKYFKNYRGKYFTAGDVLNLTSGGTPSTEINKYWDHGNIKWMSSGDVHLKKIYDVPGRITEEGLKNSSAKMLPINSVVVALAGQGKTKGTVAITKTELCTNQSVAAYLPNESEILPEFLYHYLDSKYEMFREITGDKNSRTGLNLSILKSILIPKLSLKDQNVVAEKFNSIDNLSAELENMVTKTKQIQKQLINQIFS